MDPSKTVYVAMGGNVGPTLELIDEALAALQELAHGPIRLSQIYRTTPLCDQQQRDYLNAVCSFRARLEPGALLGAMQRIERNLGKMAKSKDAPRPIDLDLLFYGSLRMETPRLTLPHPRWQERLFVLCPLRDLTPRINVEHQWFELDELIDQLDSQAEGVVPLYMSNLLSLDPYGITQSTTG